MKKIEIRRHALNDSGLREGMLSPEGIKQARGVGAEQMRGQGYTHIAVSELFRTSQTAAAMAEGAGDFTASSLVVLPALFTKRLDELAAYIKEHGSVVKPDHPVIKKESLRMAEEFAAHVENLPQDANLLAIGHSPLIEIMVYGLTGKIIAPLKECEKFELNDTQFKRGLVFDGDLPI
ncbi:MAG: phosphoglycerate mutase family protein [Patescibacteria group bacterium]|nr:phosphoglycerate mutase family protein [Patescibacteria group bacterium]